MSAVVSNITLSDCVQRYVRIQNRNGISHCETLLFELPSPGFVFPKLEKKSVEKTSQDSITHVKFFSKTFLTTSQATLGDIQNFFEKHV